MKSKLDILPAGKQEELAFVVRTIRAGFEHVTARRTMPHLREAQLLKILFGSYARGDWIEDPVAAISPTTICSSSSIMRH